MSEWISHDGSGCPVPVGVLIETWRLDGEHRSGLVRSDFYNVMNIGYGFNQWFWAVSGRPEFVSGTDVIAYRIIDDSSKAKTERREARIASFRKLTEINPLDVRKAPAKKKVSTQ